MTTTMTAKAITMLTILVTYAVATNGGKSKGAGYSMPVVAPMFPSIPSSNPADCAPGMSIGNNMSNMPNLPPFMNMQPPVVAPPASSGAPCMLCGNSGNNNNNYGDSDDNGGAGAGAGAPDGSDDGSGAGAGNGDGSSGNRVIFAQGSVAGTGIPTQSVIRVPFVNPFPVPNFSGMVDPDTFADPTRQIFAQGSVGGPLPVQSVVKVPLINGR